MRIIHYVFPILFSFLLLSCSRNSGSFNTGSLSLGLDGRGNIVHITDRSSGKDYLAGGHPAPLLSIRVGGRIIPPGSMEYDRKYGEMVFTYDPVGVTARVGVAEYHSHLRFELVSIEPAEPVEMVIWGPYPTTIGDVIGETVGVVRDGEYALGIQALNQKTLGGYPWTDNDCMPQIDIFDSDDYSDLSEEGKRYVLYRVEAAKPEDFGSTLQAYCRNRSEDRIIENWGHERYLAPAFDDGGVTGSAIALFGCPSDEVLNYIEQVEMDEDLPHPMMAGEWAKRSQAASSSYMIMDFSEKDIDRALDYTKKAGLRYLYHPGPFETWGHFILDDRFPSGWDGLKACVDKARQENVFLGLHTLSNFITKNDPYVTPVPDNRLAKVGKTVLTGAIDAAEKDIAIEDPKLFRPAESIAMQTVQVGKELIKYNELSQGPPWMLLDCERGAYGTKAADHPAGTDVSLLADHDYKVFLSDADLTMEIAGTIADLFNKTGIRQLSFDGLEGNRSTGMGNYGEILMTSTWYDHLDEDVKTHYIADASRTSHYFWHIYTRMNWGEPWYAGFRESQADYRFRNQEYFKRNLMPGMLGWFLMTDKTSLEDIEWMLSKAAAYNAGFGLVCDYKSLEGNGQSAEILELINRWEKARMERRFTAEVMEELKSTVKEFHLEEDTPGNLTLWTYAIGRMELGINDRQPGETGLTSTGFDNIYPEQPLSFMLKVPDEAWIEGLELAIDKATVLDVKDPVGPGQAIRYTGGDELHIYSPAWELLRTVPVDKEKMKVSTGGHVIEVRATSAADPGQPLKIEFKTKGNPQNIPSS